MSLSFVVGNRSNRVVLGAFWPEAARIENEQKTRAKRRIRVRISAGVEDRARKLVLPATECKNGIYEAVALAGTKSAPSSKRNFLRSSRRNNSKLMQAWINCDPTERYQTILMSKPVR